MLSYWLIAADSSNFFQLYAHTQPNDENGLVIFSAFYIQKLSRQGLKLPPPQHNNSRKMIPGQEWSDSRNDIYQTMAFEFEYDREH